MAKLLDESWKNWTKENLELGVSPKTIFDTLAKNNFDLNDIEKHMDWKSENKKVSDSKSISTSIINSSTHIEGAKQLKIQNDALEIYSIEGFLTKEECDGLVKLIKKNKKKSTVSTANKADGYIDEEWRTSTTCNLATSSDSLVASVDNKILECIGIHASRGESIQGQHYDKTQEFKQHTDTFQPNSGEYKKHCENVGGQRTWTFMIYLDNTKEGGETKFNKIKDSDGNSVEFKPTKGMAVVWNNLNKDGTINHNSMHQGCPVVSGEKTIITKWFREQKIMS